MLPSGSEPNPSLVQARSRHVAKGIGNERKGGQTWTVEVANPAPPMYSSPGTPMGTGCIWASST